MVFKITNAKMNFDYESLEGILYENKSFDRYSFVGANLQNATFIDCYLRGSNFTDADLRGATFQNVNTRESSFVGARMQDGNFSNNNMHRCNFTDTNCRKTDFTNTDLRGSNFRNARCQQANFTNAWIKGIGGRGMDLSNATIPAWFRDPTVQFQLMEPDTICYSWKLTNNTSTGIYHSKLTYVVGEIADAEKQDAGFKALTERHHADIAPGAHRPDVQPLTQLHMTARSKGKDVNPGIAVAPIDWVLREWNMMGANPHWKLYMVSFKAKDVLASVGVAKFNVRKLKVEKEIDIMQFYDQLRD